jgi:hypothetical protein
MTPESPRARLEPIIEKLRSLTGGTESYLLQEKAIADTISAVEIIEAMGRLAISVDSMANRSVTVMNNLIDRVDKATAQAEVASMESGKVAHESAKLSRQLNRLTIVIVIAAIASAAAAVVQAWAAWYTV